jgi:hypothetical protein
MAMWRSAAAFALLAQPLVSPALGQAGGEGTTVIPKVVQDPCATPRPGEEVVVCGRRDERSPYRLPELQEGFDWRGDVDSVSRERHSLYEMGAFGIGSCSTVGPGGWTGCDFIKWKAEKEQRAGRPRFGGPGD